VSDLTLQELIDHCADRRVTVEIRTRPRTDARLVVRVLHERDRDRSLVGDVLSVRGTLPIEPFDATLTIADGDEHGGRACRVEVLVDAARGLAALRIIEPQHGDTSEPDAVRWPERLPPHPPVHPADCPCTYCVPAPRRVDDPPPLTEGDAPTQGDGST
jgi:hypothetical protein